MENKLKILNDIRKVMDTLPSSWHLESEEVKKELYDFRERLERLAE